MNLEALDWRLRTAMREHLDLINARHPEGARSADINTFVVDGRTVPLIVQPGIWKPAGLDAALSIRTTYTRPGAPPPYEDSLSDEGLVRYKYRGEDPLHSDNRALRTAMQRSLPLAYFIGIERGVYHPHCPVYVVGEDPARQEFVIAVDEGQRLLGVGAHVLDDDQRKYSLRLAQSRLHQPVFRARVLRAYDTACAICRLRHAELLDAAHILPDGHPRGRPVVPNGLALCKIHHAAYDANIVGIRPDLRIEVRTDILAEIDGPMLRHGIQGIDGGNLTVPRSHDARPDRDALEERYALFRSSA